MTSRTKDKVKTAEAPPIRAIEAPKIASESKLDITPETAPETDQNATGVQDMDEKPAAGFPIVGIGASAGGLAAFEAFFSGMPADIDPGMAFVLVQHLAPDHKSILADLILLDINMPEMNGFEVCKRLKADEVLKDIPVIFISALTETADKVKAFAVGGVDYVTKPFQFEEVNARVETHLRLRRQQLELQALNELKNHFLGMVAHDLRTPLCVIMGMSELLANQLSPLLTEKQSRFFEMLLASSQFMTGMVKDLLDMSAIESGHLTIERRMIDISVPIERSVEINEVFASPKNISIAISCQEQLPQVFADTNRIVQVINNLLSNAIKYSQLGTNITVRLRHENNEVIISVADQGPGIPEKEQHKLFQAFGKTSVRPTSDSECSTGLGLLIVKKIMEAHEGRIWLLSEPGKGTEFFFSLPVMP